MNYSFKNISKIYLAFFIVVFSFALISVSLPSNAKAVSSGDWKPGRIIDDAVFFNSNSMSIGQIQDFLNSKVPVCDTNHQASFWSGGVYNAPPYTCLKDYNEGGKSSAQIIWEAGQTHGINPQTLIVMLQKESALVTDTWAAPWQYKSAMGYGCPDTADCDSKYFGFTNQVNNAAWQLRAYVNNPNGYNFKAGVTRNIQWSPNGACGSSAVYLENSATAALYNYTPYQPNQAALNNLYGTGDGCSAYGNRNFWRMFNDWFGSTQASMSVSNVNWNFESLDGKDASVSGDSGDFGKYPNSITYNNMLHTFYYDSASGNLRHSWADSSGWHFETLDGEGGPNGRINADVGLFGKTAIYDGKLYVTYYDTQEHNLRIGYLSDDGWHFETLDGEGGPNGRINADIGQDIAITQFGDSLQLYYFDATNGNLRHAWANGSGWHFENLDGDANAISRQSSNVGIRPTIIGDDAHNILHVYYFDGDNSAVRQAWIDNTGWHFAYIDGTYTAISKDNTPVPVDSSVGGAIFNDSYQLFYRINDSTHIKHAWGFLK